MKTIALVGIDGVGKSTQAKLLVETLNSMGKKAIVVKGDNLNCQLFDFLEQENIKIQPQIKYHGSLLDFLNTQLKFKQEYKDHIYVWDRYFYCINSYFKALNVDINDSFSLIEYFDKPDIIFYMDLEPDLAVQRIKQSGRKLKSKENSEYLSKVRENYLNDTNHYGFYKIDCNSSSEEIHQQMLTKVNDKLI